MHCVRIAKSMLRQNQQSSTRSCWRCISAARSARRWPIFLLSCCSSFSTFAETAAWQVVRMEALCLVGEKEGNFWLNGARVAEGARRGVAERERLGTERWGRSNPQKLSGWRGGEREKWRGLRGVAGRLALNRQSGLCQHGCGAIDASVRQDRRCVVDAERQGLTAWA